MSKDLPCSLQRKSNVRVVKRSNKPCRCKKMLMLAYWLWYVIDYNMSISITDIKAFFRQGKNSLYNRTLRCCTRNQSVSIYSFLVYTWVLRAWGIWARNTQQPAFQWRSTPHKGCQTHQQHKPRKRVKNNNKRKNTLAQPALILFAYASCIQKWVNKPLWGALAQGRLLTWESEQNRKKKEMKRRQKKERIWSVWECCAGESGG